MKCLCLSVDDKNNISIIENHCGKDILFRILNEDYLNSKSQEILIKYIKEMRLSLEEEDKMILIMKDKELLKELKT